jgi:type VI secretion system protein ImpE
MNAGELFKAGKLQDAIDAQIKEVKSHPADQNKRVFLFELLVFSGDLDRARKQIEALTYTEVELEGARQRLRELLDAEAQRRRVFHEGAKPQSFLEQPEHLKLRLQALEHLRRQQPADASHVLAQADAQAPKLSGELNRQAFSGVRDYDELLGPVLEVMAKGNYYWIPLEQVASVLANPPKYPRDLLWFPARLELCDGSAGDVFLPVLYPDSHEETDELVRLGKTTEWKMPEIGPMRGVGRHQFLVGDNPVALPSWCELRIHA